MKKNEFYAKYANTPLEKRDSIMREIQVDLLPLTY